MDKELENEILHLCIDKDKAVICLEELISVVKGTQEETENSYLGLLFLADTIGKLNLFITSFFNSNRGEGKEPVIKPKTTSGKTSIKRLQKLNRKVIMKICGKSL